MKGFTQEMFCERYILEVMPYDTCITGNLNLS